MTIIRDQRAARGEIGHDMGDARAGSYLRLKRAHECLEVLIARRRPLGADHDDIGRLLACGPDDLVV